MLSDPPSFSLSALLSGAWAEQAQTYVSDHFPLREAFVGLHAYLQQLLGQNGDSGVLRGKDGWLFAVQEKVDLAHAADNVRKVRDFAAQNGLEPTWLLVPCAASLLEDRLPRFHPTYRDGELLDTVRAACGGDAFVDARGILAPDAERNYYKTDHHLTSAGSRALYEAFCAEKGLTAQRFFLTQTSGGFYGTAYSKSGLWLTNPDTLELFTEPDGDYTVTITEGTQSTTYASLYFPAHLNEKDQYPVFLDGNHSVVKIENNRCRNGKKLLLLKDSFAHCFATFLAANYETVVMVDLRYCREPLSPLIAQEGLHELLVLYGAEDFASSTDLAWLSLL